MEIELIQESQYGNNINVNGDNIAGNKYVINDNSYELLYEDHFDEDSLEIKPSIDFLFDVLIETRLVFLNGNGFDLNNLARYLAKYTVDRIGFNSNSIKITRIAQENCQFIEFIEEKYQPNRIYLILDTDIILLGSNIDLLYELVSKEYYFILTTKNLKGDWQKSYIKYKEFIECCWPTLSFEKLYPEENVISFVKERITRGNINISDKFVEKISQLKNLVKINSFLNYAQRQNINNQDLLDDSLNNIYKQIQEESSEFTDRFDHYLLNRERYLLITIFSLNGLPRDQLLAISDYLTDHVWKYWEPNISYYDFYDIKKWEFYFSLDSGLIDLKYYDAIYEFFSYYYKHYRRHYKKFIDVLIKLIEFSLVNTSELEHDIFPDRVGRELFRTICARFFGIVLRFEPVLISEIFVRLSKINNEGAYALIAKIAKIHYFENEQPDIIIIILDQYINAKGAYYEKLKNEFPEDNRKPKEISVTIAAFLLKYLMDSCASNQVPTVLINQFENLIIRKDLIDCLAYNKKLISPIFKRHFNQLFDKIDFLISTKLSEIIPRLFSSQYQYDSKLINGKLNEWLNNSFDLDKEDESTSLAISMILTMIEIKRIYPDYDLPSLRNIAYVVNSRLNVKDLVKVMNKLDDAKMISFLLIELSIEKRSEFVEELAKLYLNQRQGLSKDSSATFQSSINGITYTFWKNDAEKPKLALQEVTNYWLTQNTYPELVQLAYLAKTKFLDIFELEEDRIVNENSILTEDEEDKTNIMVRLAYYYLKPSTKISLYSKYISIPLGLGKVNSSDKLFTVSSLLPILYQIDTKSDSYSNFINKLRKENFAWLADALDLIMFWEKIKIGIIIFSIIFTLLVIMIYKN